MPTNVSMLHANSAARFLPPLDGTEPLWRMQSSGSESEAVLSCDIGVEIGAGVGSVVDSVVLI
jgi:hypothetical protein